MASQFSMPTREVMEVYQASKVEASTPGQLVLQTYDYVIGSCRRGEMVQAKKGLVELMGALNLDHLDVSGPLFRLYEYCLELIRDEKLEEAIGVLSELRQSWLGVLDNAQSGSGARR
jgi:flagellin-specific chaperone FliS